jgi:hypothetical protein
MAQFDFCVLMLPLILRRPVTDRRRWDHDAVSKRAAEVIQWRGIIKALKVMRLRRLLRVRLNTEILLNHTKKFIAQKSTNLTGYHTGCVPWSMEFRMLPLGARRCFASAALCCRCGGSTCRCALQSQCLVPALPRWSTLSPDCQRRLDYNLIERFTERRCKDEKYINTWCTTL